MKMQEVWQVSQYEGRQLPDAENTANTKSVVCVRQTSFPQAVCQDALACGHMVSGGQRIFIRKCIFSRYSYKSSTVGTGGSFPGGKARPGRDADHSPPSSAEVKKEYELYLLSPKCASMERKGTTLPFTLLRSTQALVHNLPQSFPTRAVLSFAMPAPL
jgi:hypothetical protein